MEFIYKSIDLIMIDFLLNKVELRCFFNLVTNCPM